MLELSPNAELRSEHHIGGDETGFYLSGAGKMCLERAHIHNQAIIIILHSHRATSA